MEDRPEYRIKDAADRFKQAMSADNLPPKKYPVHAAVIHKVTEAVTSNLGITARGFSHAATSREFDNLYDEIKTDPLLMLYPKVTRFLVDAILDGNPPNWIMGRVWTRVLLEERDKNLGMVYNALAKRDAIHIITDSLEPPFSTDPSLLEALAQMMIYESLPNAQKFMTCDYPLLSSFIERVAVLIIVKDETTINAKIQYSFEGDETYTDVQTVRIA